MSKRKLSNSGQIAVTAALAVIAVSLVLVFRAICNKGKIAGSEINESDFFSMVKAHEVAVIRVYASRNTLLIADIKGEIYHLKQPSKPILDIISLPNQGFDVYRVSADIEATPEYCPKT